MRRRAGRPLGKAIASSTAALAMLAGLPGGATAASAYDPGPGASTRGTREVLYVGNNWAGTADVIDPRTFRKLARPINIVPDKEEREREILADPAHAAVFLGNREFVGEGHDQYVDDMFSSPNGRWLYVSRPSFADVVAIDLRTRRIVWRTRISGYRADHMAISPGGRRLVVSASTARVADVIDVRGGRIVGSFESGDQPHENNFSRNGRWIFHASIGRVFTPTDQPEMDETKGDRWFQVVDAKTLRVVRRIDMGERLERYGFDDMSSSVRPMALSRDERYLYFQISFFHGFIEFDLRRNRVTRLVTLPLSREAARMRREEYPLDSAHHGLTSNPAGTKLCAAGTVSSYAAIVTRTTLRYKIVPVGPKPYWSTSSTDGRYCFVSVSGDDAVAVIDWRTARRVAKIRVGDHPQRMRMGRIRSAFVARSRVAPRFTG